MTDDTGAVQGIAVTATTNGGATGAWQYSTDGGTTWFSVGTRPLNAAAQEHRLRPLQPRRPKGGTPTLTLRGWDQTTGTATNGAIMSEADVATNGCTAFSASSATINVIAVSDVNDAPEIVTAASNATSTENPGGRGWQWPRDQDDSGQRRRSSISTGFTAGDTPAVTVKRGISASFAKRQHRRPDPHRHRQRRGLPNGKANNLTYTHASEDPTINLSDFYVSLSP